MSSTIGANKPARMPAVSTHTEPASPSVTETAPIHALPPAQPPLPVVTPTAQSKTDAELRVMSAGRQPQLGVEAKWANQFCAALEPTLDARGFTGNRGIIQAHLQSLQGPALVQECRVLEHAFKSPNALAALNTYEAGLRLSMQNPEATQRLTPDVREWLVKGVADPANRKMAGEGILDGQTAERAARALVDMPESQYSQLKTALNTAGRGPEGHLIKGADPAAERSVVLAMTGALADMLRPGASNHGAPELAANRITEWADGIRGGLREELASRLKDLAHREQQPDTVGEDAQLANVDMQDALQKQQQTLQMLSTISKLVSDTSMAIVRKMGG